MNRDAGGRFSSFLVGDLLPAAPLVLMSLLGGREVAAAWFAVFCLDWS